MLTLVCDIDTGQIDANTLAAGIELAQHYAAEALRLSGASRVSIRLRDAQRLLLWLYRLPESLVSLPDIYQRGPNDIRDKATALELVRIIEEHGHLTPVAGGATIAGHFRREVWRIIRG